MALFLQFKDSKEAFFGDNTIQEYSLTSAPAPEPTNKRLKKVHRKELQKIEKENTPSFYSQPNKFIWAAKMAVYGFSIYSLQMLANSQFLS
jgi:hypothetical protein